MRRGPVCVAIALALAGCAGEPVATRAEGPRVIATFEGRYEDGELTLRERMPGGRAGEAALVGIDPLFSVIPGDGTTTPLPGGCSRRTSRVRVTGRGTTHHERVYVALVELSVTGTTTSVAVARSASSAVADFGLTSHVPNALWRVGELGRGSSETYEMTFDTCAPPGSTATFTFVAQAYGIVVEPTERATLAAGARDAPASDYPPRAAGGSIGTSSVALSEDARYAAFATRSSVLLGGAGGQHVVVRDLRSATISIASVDPSGAAPSGCRASDPHLSADGSIVVFASVGCTLLPALGAAPPHPQIYARDRITGTTSLVSTSIGGGYANGSSARPRISADGSTIVFESMASDLVAGAPARACLEVYRRAGGVTTHVSARAAGGFAPACDPRRPPGRAPDVDGDGSHVVLTSGAQLDPSDTDSLDDVYVRDVPGGTIARLSVSETGAELTGGTSSGAAAISADGAFVVFLSDHANVVLGGTPGVRHVYRRSSSPTDPGSIERVTVTPLDLETRSRELATQWPAISRTGRFVAFWSARTELASVPGRFAPAGIQLYACDMESPAPALARCFVASTLQPLAGAAFVPLAGTTAPGGRIALVVPRDDDAGCVGYQAMPRGWGALDASEIQVLVSPVGDPRAQMPSPSP